MAATLKKFQEKHLSQKSFNIGIEINNYGMA